MTVTYNGNGAEGNVTDGNSYFNGASAEILSSDGLTYDGHTFGSWNTEPDGTGITYNPGDKVIINGNVTLYAVWNRITNEPSDEPSDEPSEETSDKPNDESSDEPSDEPLEESSETPSEDHENPDTIPTGDNTPILFVIGTMLSSSACVFILRKKKVNR